MTSPETNDLNRNAIGRKKFLLTTGAAAGAAALFGSAPRAYATGTLPAYLDSVETFTADQTFSGKALFKSGKPWVDVKAYGAYGDGMHDDSGAIQLAINTVVKVDPVNGDLTPNNPIIYFPPGDYLLNSPTTSALTTPNNGSNFCLMGAGCQSSRLVWGPLAPVSTQAAPQAMLQLINPFQVHIKDMGFIGRSGANMPTYGIQLRRAPGSLGGGSTANIVERVFIGNLTSGGPYLDTAIAYTADAGQDQNDDNGTFRDVSIQYVNTGYRFGTLNGLVNKIIGGAVQNCSVAAIDNTPVSPSTYGGNYTVFGTRFAGNKLTFQISQSTNPSSSNPIQIIGAQIGTTASPETALLASSALVWQHTVFVGGGAILADPGVGQYSIAYNSVAGPLEFYGFRIYSPTGITMNFPNTGLVNFYGGKVRTKSCNYNCLLHYHGTAESIAAPVFTPTASSISASLVQFGYNNHWSGSNGYISPTYIVPIGAAGPGATCSVVGNILGGVITVTTGSSGLGVGPILQLFLTEGFPVAPQVLLSPANANAAGVMNIVFSGQILPPGFYYANSANAIFLNVGPTATLAPSTTYVWNYLMQG